MRKRGPTDVANSFTLPAYPKASMATVPFGSLLERHGTDWFPGCTQDLFTPLQRNSDTPTDVLVHDRRILHLDPVFTHVHVVHSSNQRDLSTYVKWRLPAIRTSASLSEGGDGARDHCNRDDPRVSRSWRKFITRARPIILHEVGHVVDYIEELRIRITGECAK